MKTFEEIYQKVREAEKAYDKAESISEKNKIRVQICQATAEISESSREARILWHEYENSRDRGEDCINIRSIVIWDREVEAYVDCMRMFGITKFVFYSGYTDAIETAGLFTEYGCKLEGTVKDKDGNHGLLFTVSMR